MSRGKEEEVNRNSAKNIVFIKKNLDEAEGGFFFLFLQSLITVALKLRKNRSRARFFKCFHVPFLVPVSGMKSFIRVATNHTWILPLTLPCEEKRFFIL